MNGIVSTAVIPGLVHIQTDLAPGLSDQTEPSITHQKGVISASLCTHNATCLHRGAAVSETVSQSVPPPDNKSRFRKLLVLRGSELPLIIFSNETKSRLSVFSNVLPRLAPCHRRPDCFDSSSKLCDGRACHRTVDAIGRARVPALPPVH